MTNLSTTEAMKFPKCLIYIFNTQKRNVRKEHRWEFSNTKCKSNFTYSTVDTHFCTLLRGDYIAGLCASGGNVHRNVKIIAAPRRRWCWLHMIALPTYWKLWFIFNNFIKISIWRGLSWLLLTPHSLIGNARTLRRFQYVKRKRWRAA